MKIMKNNNENDALAFILALFCDPGGSTLTRFPMDLFIAS